MIGSLYSGISGLKAQTSAMAVIGDNVANVNTTGFKSSTVEFSNVFNATLGQSRTQIGRGVMMSGLSANWNSGTLENTNTVTDLAINGQGMFIVRDASNNGQYYTRAGQFEFNGANMLVNTDGLEVQGYAIDPNTGATGALGTITLPNGVSTPNATQNITMGLNLDSGAAVGDTFDTTVSVYDSLGDSIEMNLVFENTAANTWRWYVSPSIGTATPAGPGATPQYNVLAFGPTGALLPASSTPASANPTITISGLPGNNVSLTWNMLDGTGATDGSVTGYAGQSVKTSQTQDGYPSGMLQGISIDDFGIFTALYSNGTMAPFAQVALADFASYSGLAKQGSNLFVSSLASGQPVVATPGSAGVGKIASSSLEMSNVDLAQEFVSLITTQRAFQANSKVITTSDEVLNDLINIKR
ncbi:MAG: flagellar hook protein FlgE [Desulfobacteraceae bacterium]|nr:flagellar hook protein FlgE [Desulfobacteraceae bacterium]